MFELGKYEKEQNYILVVQKLEMHRNQKTSCGVEHRVDDRKMSVCTL